MTLDPFAFLEILGFDVDSAVGFEGGGGLDLGDAIRISDDLLPAGERRCVWGGHGAASHHPGGGEVVILELGRFGIDGDDGFAAVSALVDGVGDADSLTVENPFPAHDIESGFLWCGVCEWAFEGFAQERAERFETFGEICGGVGGFGGLGKDDQEEEAGDGGAERAMERGVEYFHAMGRVVVGRRVGVLITGLRLVLKGILDVWCENLDTMKRKPDLGF